ncbi:MAG: hypothetical protein KAU48_08420, partial [Candidatus Thorarchaeota archaeon]|nr:hypothetical protein [Candidatus Thorarchaeota archaeon]
IYIVLSLFARVSGVVANETNNICEASRRRKIKDSFLVFIKAFLSRGRGCNVAPKFSTNID